MAFGLKKGKKEVVGGSNDVPTHQSERISNRLDTKLVSANESDNKPVAKLSKIKKKHLIASGVAVILVILGAAYWNYRYSPIKIGSHTINRQELADAGDAVKNAREANEHEAGNADEEGRNQAVLLAALKTEADKHGISYERSDIDKLLKDSFDHHGGKDEYFRYMLETNKWNKDDVYRYRTIEYLKNKLEKDLIARRTYALMFIRWDNLKLYNPDNFEELYKQKEELLKNKYLPLFEQGADAKTLASKADYQDGATEKEQMKIFSETDGVPVTFAVEEMGNGELQKYQEGEDMLTRLETLENVGDYTGPFKSNMGILVIARLEKSEGGRYRSWDHLRQRYQEESGISFGPSLQKRLFSSIKSVFDNPSINPLKSQKAEAAQLNCLTQKPVIYAVTYLDEDTGAHLPASALAGIAFGFGANRATSHCNPNEYRAHGWSVGPAFNAAGRTWHNVSKAFHINNQASVRIEVDCNGPEWSIIGDVQRNIPGYSYVRRVYAASSQQAPFEWKPGLNGNNVKWTLMYYRKTANPVTTVTCVVTPDVKGWVRQANGNMTITGGIKITTTGSGSGTVPIGYTITIPDFGINQGLFLGHVNKNGTYTTPHSFSLNGRSAGQHTGRVHGVANGRQFNCPFTITIVANPVEVACKAISIPSKIDTDTDFSISGGFTTSGGGSGVVPARMTLSIPGLGVNKEVFNGNVNASGGDISHTEDSLKGSAGDYGGMFRVSIGSDIKDCPFTLVIKDRPPQISCSNILFEPSDPEPGQNFRVRGGFNISGGTGGDVGYTITLQAEGKVDEVIGSGTVSRNHGDVLSELSNELNYAVAGEYAITIHLDVNGDPDWVSPAPNCVKEVLVASKPYFKVYGGDVLAGAAEGVDNTCSKQPAKIIGWHYSSGAGAGTQLAAYALGEITNFASGQQRNVTDFNNLTFANTTDPFGGSWGSGNAPCAANFMAGATGTLTGDSLIDGRTLKAAMSDRHQTIYVQGNARIADDIRYDLSGVNNPRDYPSFRLIATGNIYVDPGVTELNGLFVAGNSFYTCSEDNAFGKPTNVELNGDCQANPLTVYGAVIADTIKLNRTGGTLSDADVNERWYNSLGTPAEKFIYSPLVWLTSDFSLGGDIDSVRTLPPAL